MGLRLSFRRKRLSEILAEAPLLSFFSGISGRLELPVMGWSVPFGSENRQVGHWLQAQDSAYSPPVRGSGENKEEFLAVNEKPGTS
jgi:hypothetical protein